MRIKEILIKRRNLAKLLFFISFDLFSISVSFWLAFFIRFDGKIPTHYYSFLPQIIILAIFFLIPLFYFSKLYSFSWAYVSISELISLFWATTIGFSFLSVTIYISQYFPFFYNFPRSVLLISYLFVFIFCGGIRFGKRIYSELLKGDKNKNTNTRFQKRTLIVGAGDAGEQIIRSILMSKSTPYLPVGFVDDNSMKQNVLIHGIRVLGRIEDIPEIVKKEKIEQMIITLPSAGLKEIKRAVEAGRKAGIKKIKIVPPLTEIINGMVSLGNIRDIRVEDLLKRQEIELDTQEISNFIRDKTILITGAAGSIGSELARQVTRFQPRVLVILDQDETGIFNLSNELNESGSNVVAVIANIKDEAKMREVFKELRPEVVFHAAAYKHVPLMEENPDEAIKNNVFGTEIVAKSALKNGTEKFVFISTDKAVNPVSVLGATKRIGEMICQVFNKTGKTKFISVRFGNVLDSRGSVIPIFREQIKMGGPVTVTHPEMKRYFMTVSEACLLVLQAGAMGRGGEVFVLDMGEPIKILDIAKEMIRLSGYEPDRDIAIVFTGKRPGEKMFEEILTAEEGTLATKNKRIFQAKLSEIDTLKFYEALEGMKVALDKTPKDRVKELLMSIISLILR